MSVPQLEDRAATVNRLFLECLFKDEELTSGVVPGNAIIIESFHGKFGLHDGRVSERKEAIRECLIGLPEQFYRDGGGGWTTLNLCVDAQGVQWGEQRDVGELCVLAIAAGLGRWLLWGMRSSMPGGLPYVMFDRAAPRRPDVTAPAAQKLTDPSEDPEVSS